MNFLSPNINEQIFTSLQIGDNRPLWSVVIPTFNCADFLKLTLDSVLIQDRGPDEMEIIVVDDLSTKDNPESVVKQYGKGRVQFYRQGKNVGKSQNYATGIRLAKGHYIHLLHGDDTIANNFYSSIEKLFEQNPQASAGFCRCNYINEEGEIIGETSVLLKESGVLTDFIGVIAVWQCIQPPSIVFKREVYEQIGGYDNRLQYIEDWEFYVRCALHFDFAYTPEILANYRVFPTNSSSQSIKGGKRVAAIRQVISIIDSYLPKEIKKRIVNERKEAVAIYLLNYIPLVVSKRDFKGFIKFSIAFFAFNRKVKLVGRYFRFVINFKKYLKD
ncbi:glycosyltransferase [Mongoliitalea lutea]|uniref:Glycosyltransferase 2-like domain-containing protein n=1 Tax=Mongoliitalea lutea TaxID=849756 RepID=A0A8J3CYV8_9BACT|nr:glycosyltransferase [Mongoliitalea lutea]GHB37162.1 hypothetical protein GCM10008106_18070 [Mongoliitalea lutea]